MPENYVAMFPVPGEEETKKIIDAAREPLLEAAALIAGDQPFPGGKLTLADRLKSGVVNRFFYRFCIKSPFTPPRPAMAVAAAPKCASPTAS